MKTAKSKARDSAGRRKKQCAGGCEGTEDRRCVEQSRQWLRVALELSDAQKRVQGRGTVEQALQASVLSLLAAANPEALLDKLEQDPRLAAALLNSLIRLCADLRKSEKEDNQPHEALSKEGNDEITRRLALM